MNTSRKCVCPLQILHIWLLGGLPQTQQGSALDPAGGASVPKLPVPTLPRNSGYTPLTAGVGNEEIALLNKVREMVNK